ncbi:DsbA family protein [Paraburkholderia silviterrae]|uniref:DSBA-like thioredoxin domain-containing protein n=1 Tax=Paraburkholderia silviterrae TaxID=2528715 RepID=A0A4V2ZY87_9BURK|nr:DsbA family protein [Paraburkholderia silviterrae]TDG18858.1 hypothetical protein EYW47_32465 [Paraburkholderia silviterrae]
MKVEFFLDYGSPCAYLANTQIHRLNTDVEITPPDAPSVMQAENNQMSSACPARMRYASLAIARWAKHYDVPFAPNRRALTFENDRLQFVQARLRDPLVKEKSE